MWKIMSVMVALVMAFALAACGDDEEETQPEQTAPEGEAAGAQALEANLEPLNDSGASGTASVELEGNQLTVSVETSGVLDGSPHAQHIHIGGNNECPTADADENGDGIVDTAEGVPAYGEVQVSLTTEEDVSADSALAIERFPTGAAEYSRTFDLPDGVTESDVQNGVIVVHGIDVNDNDEYDDEAGESSLDPSLPLEATAPAACGPLQ